MEDQSIWYAVIDLIKSALPILGTLGGTLGGFYFQNKLSTKKEERKLKKEKLEKAHKLLCKFTYQQLLVYNYTIDKLSNPNSSFPLDYGGDSDIIIELKTLVDLNIQEIEDDFGNFIEIFDKYFQMICEVNFKTISDDEVIFKKKLKKGQEDLNNEIFSLMNKIKKVY